MRLRCAVPTVLAVVLGTLLAGCGSAAKTRSGERAAAPATPAGFASVTVTVPRVNATGPMGTAHTLTVPSGWKAEAWARVPGARMELWTPEHDLLVSASSPGKVIELVPGMTPSAPPTQRVLVSGLDEPQGMAFDTLDGTRVLYIAEEQRLDRYVWNRNGTLGRRTTIVGGLLNPKDPGNHFAKTLLIAPDHTIYMTGGSASNASASDLRTHPLRAVIYTVNPTSHTLAVYATGIRNGEGLSLAPDGSLWTAVNERDGVPYPFHRAYGSGGDAYGKVIQAYVDNHPPDEVARLTRGRNLGWPYCNPDPDVDPGKVNSPLNYTNMPFADDPVTNPGGRALDCATLAPINQGLPAHSAPVGFHFLEGSTVGAPWRNGAVVAVHGSWDRRPPRAPAVLWMPWKRGARTLGRAVTLIGGFQLPSGVRWGRAVDAIPGPGADLYVSDDLSGTIYRIGPSA